MPPQQEDIETEDIFHDSVSSHTPNPTILETACTKTSDTECQLQTQSIKEDIAIMEQQIDDTTDPILRKRLNESFARLKAYLATKVSSLPVDAESNDPGLRKRLPSSELSAEPAIGIFEDGHPAGHILKRKLDEEETTEANVKRMKPSSPEDLDEPSLKPKAAEDESAKPTAKRSKYNLYEEDFTEPALHTQPIPDRLSHSPKTKETAVFEAIRKGDIGGPKLKRKAEEDEDTFEPIAKHVTHGEPEEEVIDPILKHKVGDDEEQIDEPAPKRNKGNEVDNQSTEPTLEPEAVETKPPRLPLNRKERRANKFRKEIAEMKRRAEELKDKKKPAIPLNKRLERRKPKTPSNSQSLRRLPAEIREMIFELCDFEWTGRSPALIRALRQDKQLHAEAIRVFFKKDHMYSLNGRNNWGFGQMSVDLILTIKKIKIEIQEYGNNPNFSKRKHQPKMIQVPHFTKIKPICAWPIKVQEVVIEGAFDKVSPLILRNFEHYLAGFQQRLSKITLDLRFARNSPNRDQVTGMTERINKLLKVEWHQNKVTGSLRRAGRVCRLIWKWEASDEERRFLKRISL